MSIVLEAVAGAALSAFFDVLFDKLSSPDLLKIFPQENVDADLKKWKTILMGIREVLDDAEEKQITKASVKTWMAELEDLAYDVDDILDEFATEALRRELNPEPNKSKIRKIFDACVASNRDFVKLMRPKFKDIDTRLQKIMNDKEDLGLIENTGVRTRTITSRVPATSLVESHTYGREEDKKAIVELLTGGSGGAQFSTISILGMGGLGKTTLAQLVYNDDKVGSYFAAKAWACVSQNFDILRVTKEILEDITSETCNDDNLNLVQRKLKEQLSGKKFLLILDDVWNEKYSDWTKLRIPFESGAPGSKILITTREANVSSIMGATHPYKLRELSHDACLTMFTQHALGTSDFGEQLKVEERRKILERCKGLPLAAKALAGLLRTYDRDQWKDVLNGRIWDLLEEKTDVPSTLRLSYLCLPSSLKKCFAYCSLFPKDYNFQEKELVLLWMAEGLVRETKKEKPMEYLGGEYFHDLLKRSFFQQSSINESCFVMHDLMHDLAEWAAGDLCCRLEDPSGGSKISPKVRHFSYIDHSIHHCIKKFDDFPEDMHLRTFLLLKSRSFGNLTNSDAILLPQLRSLRVLSLDGYDICELPSSIGDLKHLRYLNLSYTEIESLPESTSSLYNLQTLILKGCYNLTKLPEKIENLVNLRHLNITKANSIREMPSSIGDLKHLRYLNLSYTKITILPESTSSLYNLQTLILKYCYSLTKLPDNIENLVNLRHLNISNANSIREMPAGIAKLKSLRTLCFAHMEEWQDWIPCRVEHEEFPCLRELSITNCPKLSKFSYPLPSLKKLSIHACEQLVVSIPSHLVFQVLEILGCKGIVHDSVKVEKLIIKDCKELTSLCQDGLISPVTLDIEIESCQSLVDIKLKSTLRTLTIKDCLALKSLEFVMDEGGASSLVPLDSALTIKDCGALKSLEFVMDEGGASSLVPLDIEIESCWGLKNIKLKSTSLRTLGIKKCRQLESLEFVMDEGGASSLVPLDIAIELCLCLQNIKLKYTSLRTLTIEDCTYLKSLEFVMDEGGASSLVPLDINIASCPFLVNVKLKSTLRTLTIRHCSALESLEFVMDEGGASSTFPLLMNEENLSCIGNNNVALLEHLKIYSCPSLKCVSTIVDLSAMLKRLDISLCPNLTSLSSKGILPTTLEVLSVRECPELELIVDELHKDTLLEDLLIHNCEKLRRLPRGLHELCHLKKIVLDEPNSPSLKCISFPEEGFHTNLRELGVAGANLCKQIFEFGLHRLTSLTSLFIAKGITDSFPEEEDGKTMLMLPTSLTRLKFYEFPNLEFLSWKFFQNLSALEQISISWCPKLASLSEKCFPPSLQRLKIYACPVLKQNCEKDKGIMWSKIANIPSVMIDDVEQQK